MIIIAILNKVYLLFFTCVLTAVVLRVYTVWTADVTIMRSVDLWSGCVARSRRGPDARVCSMCVRARTKWLPRYCDRGRAICVGFNCGRHVPRPSDDELNSLRIVLFVGPYIYLFFFFDEEKPKLVSFAGGSTIGVLGGLNHPQQGRP